MKKRYAFIDLHRGWMLLLMVETHIFNDMLNPALKSEMWFQVLNFINGLIAPSFIFISGFSFFLASRRKIEEYRKFGWEFFRQVGRILLIFILGYSLHMPHLSLQHLSTYWNAPPWLDFYGVDVLQCIAAGMIIMLISRMIIKTEKGFLIFLAVAGSMFTILAPIAWRIDFANYMPVYLADYFNKTHGSLFPLFPWLAFMFAGGICCYYWLGSVKNEREQRFLAIIIYGSLLTLFISNMVLYFPPAFLNTVSELRPNTFFFLLRLAIILIIFIGLRYYEIMRKTEKSVIVYAGMESLMVYWLHLQIMYRKLFNGLSINDMVAHRFGMLEAAAASLILAVLMIIAARIWNLTKKRYPLYVRYGVIGTISLSAIYFFLN